VTGFAQVRHRLGRARLLGLGSFLAALACAAYLLFGFGYASETATSSAGTDGGVGPVLTTHSWVSALAFAQQNHDYTIVGWAGFIVVLGLLTALAAWWGRPGPVWVAAGLLFALIVLGLLSIGLFVLPVAVLVTFTASVLSAARRRRTEPAP
jgi:hypothetical protein